MKQIIAIISAIILSYSSFGIDFNSLKNGDLIFQDIDCGDMCDAIEAVTDGYKGHDFSHMGMVYMRNDSILIIESIGKGVQLTPIQKFMSRSHNPHWVGRLKAKYSDLISQAIGYALLCEGMSYDDAFLYGNGKYYCSELIYDAFKRANNNQAFFEMFPMTYKAPGTNEFFKVWQEYFAKRNQPIPEGEPGCNPGGMSLSNKIKMLGELKY